MKVWVSEKVHGTQPKFHAAPSCRLCWGAKETELADVPYPDPCLLCYPTAPRVPKLSKRPCEVCGQKRAQPCKHNGGVLVEIPTKKSATGGGSRRGVKLRYVWPDSARYYELVPT